MILVAPILICFDLILAASVGFRQGQMAKHGFLGREVSVQVRLLSGCSDTLAILRLLGEKAGDHELSTRLAFSAGSILHGFC